MGAALAITKGDTQMAILITLLFFALFVGLPCWFFIRYTRRVRTKNLRRDLAEKAKWEDEQRRKQERRGA
jgi:hypothetical protein